MNVPIVAIEMLFGTNEVDSVSLRLAGDPAADPHEEAVRVVGTALRKLAGAAPADPAWNGYRMYLDRVGRHLETGEMSW